LVLVKPETVVAWHRKGFRLFWTWKVRHGQPGRPAITREIRDLIRRMCRENPTWGAPRIHGELLKLGINIGESSVTKYMVRCRKPPSQTWRTFLENHLSQIVSVDFFTVPTIRFQVLYVFPVLPHDRRRILHFNVSRHPTAEWADQQPRETGSYSRRRNGARRNFRSNHAQIQCGWQRLACRHDYHSPRSPEPEQMLLDQTGDTNFTPEMYSSMKPHQKTSIPSKERVLNMCTHE
jgi:hypothetical protein